MKTALYMANSNLMDVVGQERLLRAYVEQQKSEVVFTFTDVRTWNQSTKNLKGLNQMLQSATQQEFDCLLVADISFLGLSLRHLLSIVNYLDVTGVRVSFLNQKISTDGPKGRALLHVFRALTHFEDAQAKDRLIKARGNGGDAELDFPAVFRKSLVKGAVST
jgi:DNA invertase Pin-like site-specific DNA recombinase